MVSTRPELFPVTRMRKLWSNNQDNEIIAAPDGSLANPAQDVFLFPYLLKEVYELHSELLLPEVTTRLHDHGNTLGRRLVSDDRISRLQLLTSHLARCP